MKTHVRKFGGASVATPEKLKQVAKSISERHQAGEKQIIVISAMGNSTNELIELAKQVSDSPSPRELDMLLSTGERVSMSLLSMALQDLNCPAISFTGSQAGILTSDEHAEARITELKPIRVDHCLEKNQIVIIAGFQGVNPKTKEITTLGRGGSDTTAVYFASHVKAKQCEILKEVNGVYTADPKLVPEAKLIPKLTLKDLYAMSLGGAKVIHHCAVEAAINIHMPIAVGRANSFEIGTLATPEIADTHSSGQVLAVNHLENSVTLTCSEHLAEGLEVQVSQLLQAKKIQILNTEISEQNLTYFIQPEQRELAVRSLHGLVNT